MTFLDILVNIWNGFKHQYCLTVYFGPLPHRVDDLILVMSNFKSLFSEFFLLLE
jgi:hypothetical protein